MQTTLFDIMVTRLAWIAHKVSLNNPTMRLRSGKMGQELFDFTEFLSYRTFGRTFFRNNKATGNNHHANYSFENRGGSTGFFKPPDGNHRAGSGRLLDYLITIFFSMLSVLYRHGSLRL